MTPVPFHQKVDLITRFQVLREKFKTKVPAYVLAMFQDALQFISVDNWRGAELVIEALERAADGKSHKKPKAENPTDEPQTEGVMDEAVRAVLDVRRERRRQRAESDVS